jgi:hypothetical protein
MKWFHNKYEWGRGRRKSFYAYYYYYYYYFTNTFYFCSRPNPMIPESLTSEFAAIYGNSCYLILKNTHCIVLYQSIIVLMTEIILLFTQRNGYQ